MKAEPLSSTAVPLRFTQSDGFVVVLQPLGAALLVTTDQAQQRVVVRATAAGLSLLVRTFDKPMGLAVDARRLALGTRDRVWLFRNAPDLCVSAAEPTRTGPAFPPALGLRAGRDVFFIVWQAEARKAGHREKDLGGARFCLTRPVRRAILGACCC